MEVITVGQILQNNTLIYEVKKDGAHIMYGETRGIAEYLDTRTTHIYKAVNNNRKLKDHDVIPFGRFEYYYDKNGFIGSKNDLINQFNLSKHARFEQPIGAFVNGEAVKEVTAQSLLKKEAEAHKKYVQEIRSRFNAHRYQGENKAYMDSLFKSAVGRWRE